MLAGDELHVAISPAAPEMSNPNFYTSQRLSIRLLSLIVCSVTLSALAQLLLKSGMSSAVVQNALAIVHTWDHFDANLS